MGCTLHKAQGHRDSLPNIIPKPQRVFTWRMPTPNESSARSDILAVDWSEDIRVTSPVCARKLTAS